MAMVLFASAFALNAKDYAPKGDKEGDLFNGYWSVDLRGGVGHTVGETSFGKLISPASSIGFGYQFTPVWGLRADFSGWKAKGAVNVPYKVYNFNYVQGTADVLIDICNIFAPYRVKRTLNPYLLVGVGANCRFNNAQAVLVKDQLTEGYYWNSPKVSAAGRAGIGLDIRLCNAVNLNIEVNSNIVSDKFNSKKGSHSPVDFQSNALIGLRINFGKGKAQKAAPAPAPVPVPVEEPKPAPVQEAKPEPVVEQPVVEQPAPAPFEKTEDIYFVINKWDITSAEAAKLDALAADLKEHPEVSVKVTGYADVQTGTAQRNQFLSQKRAEAVASYLEAKGIESGRISVDFKGSAEQPYGTPEKNRVAICIVK